jgi:sec-independent protein translocase protein TatB
MFDIGFWELILVGVVALVVLGPERLPEAARTLAKWIKLIRGTANAVKAELTEELRIQELHSNLKKAEQMDLKNLSPDLQASLEQLRAAAASVNRPYEPAPAADAAIAAERAEQTETLTTLEPELPAEPTQPAADSVVEPAKKAADTSEEVKS